MLTFLTWWASSGVGSSLLHICYCGYPFNFVYREWRLDYCVCSHISFWSHCMGLRIKCYTVYIIYCTVLYCTVLYCTVQYSTVLFCTVLIWFSLCLRYGYTVTHVRLFTANHKKPNLLTRQLLQEFHQSHTQLSWEWFNIVKCLSGGLLQTLL